MPLENSDFSTIKVIVKVTRSSAWSFLRISYCYIISHNVRAMDFNGSTFLFLVDQVRDTRTPLEFSPILNDELVIGIKQSQVRVDVVKLSLYYMLFLTPLEQLFCTVAAVEVRRYGFDSHL